MSISINNTLIEVQQRLARCIDQLNFLQQYKSLLEELDLVPDVYGTYIDFNHLGHDAIVSLIKAFPGKWIKTPSYGDNGRIDYTLTFTDTLQIRAYNGEPPPGCKIIEEVIDVPLEITPARKRTVRRIVCKE